MDSTLIHNPDVLECLANLSSDEVFTPPKVVNDMLDMLPQDLFASTTTKFLDPCCKSGIFLREIAKRLIAGTRDQYDSLQSCVDYIFHKQLFGIAITELTSLMSRRSLYCSKDPSCPYSASHFESVEGNIRFKSIQHAWNKGKCRFCGASESEYKRDSDKESHAYEFIHCANMRDLQNELLKTEYPDTYQEKDMHFDVIIGNPPYQLTTAGDENGAQAKPIYNDFVETSLKLLPSYLVMITPSRWFSGGWGLDNFRKTMIEGRHLIEIHDYPISSNCFAGVEIKGGVSYFLYSSKYTGPCKFTSHNSKESTTTVRELNNSYTDGIVRYNELVSVVDSVCNNKDFKSFGDLVSGRSPFGFNTNHHGFNIKKNSDDILYFERDGYKYMPLKSINKGCEFIDKYKVYISKAYGAGEGLPHQIINRPEFGDKGTICSGTYLMIGPFDNKNEAKNVLSYMKTKFFRALVLVNKISQNASYKVYKSVPIQDFSKPWTDAELYEKYGLSQEEIDFIESMIKPME